MAIEHSPNAIPLRVPFAPGRGFNYAKPIRVTNRTTQLTNYQVEINLNEFNFDFDKAQANGADVRVQDANGDALTYWVESWNVGTKNATIWVKLKTLEDYEDRLLWLIYGNPEASTESDGDETFVTYNITGIQAFWQMDELLWNGTSGEVEDETGTNDGTGKNSITTTANGKFNRGGNFVAASNHYVDCGSDASLALTNTITLEGWIKPNSNSVGYIASKKNLSDFDAAYGFYHDEANQILRFLGNGSLVNSNADFGGTNWMHIIITAVQSGTTYFYKDGVAAGTASTPAWSASSESFLLGARADGAGTSNHIDGIIDAIKIYNRALTSDERTALANNYLQKMGSYYNIRKWSDIPPLVEVL